MRERCVGEGARQLADAELLAVVLGTGAAGQSALDVGRAVLERFGSVGGVARAGVADLREVRGIGEARAARLHAALEAGRRALTCGLHGRPILTAQDAFDLLGVGLQGLPTEELHGLYLDRRLRPVGRRVLSQGADAYTIVDAREVYRVAVGLGANGVVLAHNHPSGDPTPSAQDRDVTRRVADAGRILGVPLLDHLVVGAAGFVSLAEDGALPAWSGSGMPMWTAQR